MGSVDQDIEFMDRQRLKAEVRKLREGIRRHRDSRGHNLCWWHPELWGLLPEKTDPVPEAPPSDEFLEKCQEYRRSLGA